MMRARNIIRDKALTFLLVVAVSFIMLTSHASALAMGLGGSVSMSPGEEVDRNFNIQNHGEDTSDLEVTVTIEEGEEVVELIGESVISVPADGIALVPVRIRVPTGATVGTEYTVKILGEVTGSADTGQEGSVAFIQNARNSITVRVIDEPAEELPAVTEEASSGSSMIWWIVGALIVVVIVVIVMRRGKGGSSAEPLSAASGVSMTSSAKSTSAPPADDEAPSTGKPSKK